MSQTEKIKRKYDRAAGFYDCMDFLISDKLRKRVIHKARGKVLEVGVGTGRNLHLYSSECEVTGIDFSSEMLKRAREKVEKMDLQVTLREMDVQQLDFPDDTFDTVIATCVFCSVPDPIKGFREIKRVCKPEGQIILLEHMRSENQLFGKIMDLLNPAFFSVIGCNINRRTVENAGKSGLYLRDIQNIGKTSIMKLIVASPEE